MSSPAAVVKSPSGSGRGHHPLSPTQTAFHHPGGCLPLHGGMSWPLGPYTGWAASCPVPGTMIIQYIFYRSENLLFMSNLFIIYYDMIMNIIQLLNQNTSHFSLQLLLCKEHTLIQLCQILIIMGRKYNWKLQDRDDSPFTRLVIHTL